MAVIQDETQNFNHSNSSVLMTPMAVKIRVSKTIPLF
jgi:hypothetical protein